MVWILAHSVVQLLILLRLHLKILSITGIFLQLTPFTDGFLSLSYDENTTNEPSDYSQYTALNCFVDLCLATEDIKTPETEDH